jgi:hypothetical protein
MLRHGASQHERQSPTVAQDPGGALTPRVDAAGLPELAASAPWRAMHKSTCVTAMSQNPMLYWSVDFLEPRLSDPLRGSEGCDVKPRPG